MTDSQVYHYLKIETYEPNIRHGKGKGLCAYYSIPNGTVGDILKIIYRLKDVSGTKVTIRYEKN